MIIPSQIVNHLMLYLPRFTDLFTETVTVNSASVGASNVISVNALNHGFSTGKKIITSGGTVRNSLDSATLNDNIVTFVTDFEHDLTAPLFSDDEKYLTLGGFGSVWDGQHLISGVPNRTSFQVTLPAGETVAPTITGAEYLVENRNPGIRGIYTITVTDINNFTYTLSGQPDLPIGAIDNIEINSGFRIYVASDAARAEAVYTKLAMNKPALFVIMTNVDASKDRMTTTDAVYDGTIQDDLLLRLLQNFGTFVIIPTHKDLSGGQAQDIAYGTLFNSLVATLFGFPFVDTDSRINYVVVSDGHGPSTYNSAYYMHAYDWQQSSAINYESGLLQDLNSVAFRNIESTFDLNADDMAQLQFNLNLDEEP